MYKTEQSIVVYKSPWMVLYEDKVRKNNGATEIFNRISVLNSSIVVPLFDDGSLLLVENYRHGTRTNLLELPGGFINDHEEPLDAAQRELLEETGYGCNSIECINWNYTWPGRTGQKNFIFLAKGLRKRRKPNLEDFEYAKNRRLTKKLAIQEIKTGNIKSAISISAILYALREIE